MIYAIGAAEVAFWVFLVAGLTARYVLRREHASGVLLFCVPLVDVALVAFVAIDVARGAPPSQGHALAAAYLGITVAFGRTMVAWADVRFRHRFAGGPAPIKPAKHSAAAVRALWLEWFRVVLAVSIAAGLLVLLMLLGGHFTIPTSTDELTRSPYWSTMSSMALVTVIWFLAGPAFARGQNPTGTRGV